MDFIKKITLILYRFRERGLEIFLLDAEDSQSLSLPQEDKGKVLSDKFISDESGTYLKVKDALKKVMPQQYKWIKELKDVLLDRHSVRDI
ncbi:MAG: hypothetical protein RJA90_1395 [Bacteroidota bacterium]